MNKVNWFKRAWLWIQKHRKRIGVITGIPIAAGAIIRIYDFFASHWSAIAASYNNFSITLNFTKFSFLALGWLLFFLMALLSIIRLIFKTAEKQKLEKAKTKVNCLIKQWQELTKAIEAMEARPEPKTKAPKELVPDHAILGLLEYKENLRTEYKNFRFECKERKDYAVTEIDDLALKYPKIDSLAKTLKGIVIGNQQLDISKEALRDTKDELKRIVGTLQNIYKSLE